MILHPHEPNRILSELPDDQRARLERYGEDVALNVGTILIEAGHVINHIYFLRTGLVSLLVVLPDEKIADAGFVNQDCAAGSVYDIDEPISFARVAVSAKGHALRLPREHYEGFRKESAELRTAIDRCNNRITARSQQTAACNLIHRLEQRLCRWLLQISEETSDSDIAVTQDHLAQVLGVNRTRLNEALGSLYALHAISQTHRGVFRVDNLEPIVAHACGCYQSMRYRPADGRRVA